MLSVSRVSSGKLSSYYDQDDYYFKNDNAEIVGSGKEVFGDALGHANHMAKEKFEAICNLKVSAKDEEKNNVFRAMDLTFSAPKSVSILYGCGDADTRQAMQDAHDAAVKEALKHIEDSGMFQCRIKWKGRVYYQRAEGMTAAIFNHATSRTLDPQLHAHCLIANIAKPKGKRKFVAADFKAICSNKKALGAIYRASLMKHLQQAGFAVESTNKKEAFFEVKGFTKDQLDIFSTRRAEIEKYLQQIGKYDAKNAAEATIRTRKAKQSVDQRDVERIWRTVAAENNIPTSAPQHAVSLDHTEKQTTVVKTALAQLESLDGVFTKEKLYQTCMTEAINQGVGIDVADIAAIMEKLRPDFLQIPGQRADVTWISDQHTTQALVDAERNILRWLEEGFGSRKPFISASKIKAGLADFNARNYKAQGWKLKAEQERMIEHVLSCPDLVCAVQGRAGTGKTTAAQVLREICGPAKIHGLALQAVAAKNLQDEAGIISGTIDGFLKSIENENQQLITKISNGILIVDEAGMVGSMHMAKLMAIAKKYNTRIALIGDTDQLTPVSAGNPFLKLQEFVSASCQKMKIVELKDITRQKTEQLLESVKSTVINRDVAAALNRLQGKETDGRSKILSSYRIDGRCQILASIPEHNVAANTPATITAVTADTITLTLGDKNKRTITLAQATHADLLGEPTHIIEIGNKRARLDAIVDETLGEYLSGKNPLVITSENKDREYLNDRIRYRMQRSGLLDPAADQDFILRDKSGDPLPRKLAPGDRLVFLRNEAQLVVQNGNMATIESIEGTVLNVRMNDAGNRLVSVDTRDYPWLDYGYALTTYKSQGQTVDKVIYHAKTTSRLLTANEFYVGISRERFDISLYTDSTSRLVAKASKWAKKISAKDVYEAGLQKELEKRARTNRPLVAKLTHTFFSFFASKHPDDLTPAQPSKTSNQTHTQSPATHSPSHPQQPFSQRLDAAFSLAGLRELVERSVATVREFLTAPTTPTLTPQHPLFEQILAAFAAWQKEKARLRTLSKDTSAASLRAQQERATNAFVATVRDTVTAAMAPASLAQSVLTVLSHWEQNRDAIKNDSSRLYKDAAGQDRTPSEDEKKTIISRYHKNDLALKTSLEHLSKTLSQHPPRNPHEKGKTL